MSQVYISLAVQILHIYGNSNYFICSIVTTDGKCTINKMPKKEKETFQVVCLQSKLKEKGLLV